MRFSLSLAILGIATLAPAAAKADTISWTSWSFPAVTASPYVAPGIATGTLIINGNPITVTYTGQLINTSGATDWSPSSTFDGGIGPAPPNGNAEVAMTGGQSYTETITFSSSVTNPILAIWSLGQNGIIGQYVFAAGQPFTITSGGPNAQYGGASIYSVGNTVFGEEGNGDVQFAGVYKTITFTTPVYENYYAFTVGADVAPVPEPATLGLMGTGILGLVALGRKKLTGR
jgi:hypothetical protein